MHTRRALGLLLLQANLLQQIFADGVIGRAEKPAEDPRFRDVEPEGDIEATDGVAKKRRRRRRKPTGGDESATVSE